MAIIAPIHMSGDKDMASNYRPIAILPVVSKILEKVVAAQLTEYLESSSLDLDPNTQQKSLTATCLTGSRISW